MTILSIHDREHMLQRFLAVRNLTLEIAAPLSEEDQCVQAMADTSPIKWHLGHTSWFFETVILSQFQPAYTEYSAQFLYHFNSYYESLGPRQPRPQRGFITRPANSEVRAYRQHIDEAIGRWVVNAPDAVWMQAFPFFELGLNHEQQHQELMLTDLKYMLYQNPFEQVYVQRPSANLPTLQANQLAWLERSGGTHHFGHAGNTFCFDNETPQHARLVYPHQLANRLVSCGDYLEFILDGGYQKPAYWLSDGWAKVQEHSWEMPLYWRHHANEGWQVYSLYGFEALVPDQPVTHLSYYEACAYANWAGARLPTEFELELALQANQPIDSPQRANGSWLAALHPAAEPAGAGKLHQGFGACWQWSCSGYEAYPKFQPFSGAVAEYNGKFMVGQQVLKGSSCVTPSGHARASYRNFFPPAAQWQFTGLRLARDI